MHKTNANMYQNVVEEVLPRRLTCESVEGRDGQLHVNEHEILAEAIQCDTGISGRKERHWRAADS